jgi:hypothetical protein
LGVVWHLIPTLHSHFRITSEHISQRYEGPQRRRRRHEIVRNRYGIGIVR